jgi:hypothetical protein
MKAIWKFKLPAPRAVIDMPVGAQVIRVARQGPVICLWAIVKTDNNTLERRQFVTVGTGSPIPDDGRYLGTWDDGPFVWHLFEPTQASGGTVDGK